MHRWPGHTATSVAHPGGQLVHTASCAAASMHVLVGGAQPSSLRCALRLCLGQCGGQRIKAGAWEICGRTTAWCTHRKASCFAHVAVAAAAHRAALVRARVGARADECFRAAQAAVVQGWGSPCQQRTFASSQPSAKQQQQPLCDGQPPQPGESAAKESFAGAPSWWPSWWSRP